MRKNYDGKKIRWLEMMGLHLEQAIRKQAPKIDGREIRFRMVFMALLGEIMDDSWEAGPNGGRYCGVGLLADNIGETYHATRRMIMKMAKLGMITCVSSWQSDRKRAPTEVFLHPDLKTAYDTGLPVGKLAPMLEQFASNYITRRDSNLNLQGFQEVVEFGEMHHEFKSLATTMNGSLLERIKKSKDSKDKEKKERQQDAKRWRGLGIDFVKCCADYWVFQRMRQGYGDTRPSWQGDPKNLDTTAKRQNLDIRKLFERYGGQKVGMAWIIFCASRPELDEQGKKVFEMNWAYKQFTSDDKRPDHFAKYFDQICGTKFYSEFAKDEAMLQRLNDYFGVLVNVQPRDKEPPLSTQELPHVPAAQSFKPSPTPVSPTKTRGDIVVPF